MLKLSRWSTSICLVLYFIIYNCIQDCHGCLNMMMLKWAPFDIRSYMCLFYMDMVINFKYLNLQWCLSFQSILYDQHGQINATVAVLLKVAKCDHGGSWRSSIFNVYKNCAFLCKHVLKPNCQRWDDEKIECVMILLLSVYTIFV